MLEQQDKLNAVDVDAGTRGQQEGKRFGNFKVCESKQPSKLFAMGYFEEK